MKVGDLVRCIPRGLVGSDGGTLATVIEFIPATHAKEVQRIRVLWAGGLEAWPIQYCKVINENR